MRFSISVFLIAAIYGCGSSEPVDTAQTSTPHRADAGDEQHKATGSHPQPASIDAANNIIREAQSQFDDKNYDKAVEFYTEAIRLDSNSAAAYVGRAKSRQRKHGKTRRVAGSALTPAATRVESPSGSTGSGDDVGDRKWREASEADLARALKLDPDHWEVHLTLGALSIERGRLPQALQQFGEAIRLNPESVEAFGGRALIHIQMDQNEQAVADLSRVIELKPNEVFAHIMRAGAYGALGDFERAIAGMDELIRIAPHDAAGYRCRGMFLIYSAQHRKGIADLKKSVSIEPGDAATWNLLAVAHMALDEQSQAMQAWSKAIELQPHDASHYSNRSLAYLGMGLYEKALADGHRAVQLDPRLWNSFAARRDAYLKLGELEKARLDATQVGWIDQLDDLNEAVHRARGNANMYLDRGSHFIENEAWDEANADLDKALRLDPKLAEAYVIRARVLFARGHYEQALDDCNAAIEIEASQSAYSLRGDVHFARTRYDEAITDFERARRIDATVAKAFWLRSRRRQNQGLAKQAAADLRRATALDPTLRR